MEEIKVGDFIRTANGVIGKIKYFTNDMFGFEDSNRNYIDYKSHNFYDSKTGSSLKDLVQAGDIILYNVNSKMTDIEIVKEHIDARTQKKTLRVGLWSLDQVEIKEILTKEKFNQMKYIVGDESNVKN